MTARIASLPMYDFADLRGAHDALWTAIASQLSELGVENVPESLERERSHRELWRNSGLLFGQACEYPLAKSYGGSLRILATPRYSAAGCEAGFYRSAIVVRAQDSAESLAAFRSKRCVVNEPDSNSGMNLLRAAVAPLAEGGRFFRSVHLSGSHRQSGEMVAAYEADIAAVDCVTLAHLKSFYPALVGKVRILCWTPRAPSLPFVTARSTDQWTVDALRAALASVLADSTLQAVRDRLLLTGIDLRPDPHFSHSRQLERAALDLSYPALA